MLMGEPKKYPWETQMILGNITHRISCVSYQIKNFEREGCMKYRIDYENVSNESEEVTDIHCSKTNSEPRKNI